MIDYIGIARKAVECDDMVKLLEGKGEYHCEFFYYGLAGIDITMLKRYTVRLVFFLILY